MQLDNYNYYFKLSGQNCPDFCPEKIIWTNAS